MNNLDMNQVIHEHRIILCCGTGGVGKTTTAASLGVFAAQQGLRTLVVTIDPARRLANAMGLDTLAADPQAVPDVENLWAMMLDPGDTIDALITRYARNEQDATRLLENPYYRQVSSSLAGSREFMAIEKLFELSNDNAWELIVVDTPPSQHALEFLDAPRRLLELLDGSGLGLLLRSANFYNRMSFGMLRRSQKQMAAFFERLTGHRLMVDITEFLHNYADVIDGFKERAQKIHELLRAECTTFLLVMLAEEDLVNQAGDFVGALDDDGMQVSGVIFNQVLSIPPLHSYKDVLREADERGISADLIQRAFDCHEHWFTISRKQQRVMDNWQKSSCKPIASTPRFPGSISTIEDLKQFSAALNR